MNRVPLGVEENLLEQHLKVRYETARDKLKHVQLRIEAGQESPFTRYEAQEVVTDLGFFLDLYGFRHESSNERAHQSE